MDTAPDFTTDLHAESRYAVASQAPCSLMS